MEKRGTECVSREPSDPVSAPLPLAWSLPNDTDVSIWAMCLPANTFPTDCQREAPPAAGSSGVPR